MNRIINVIRQYKKDVLLLAGLFAFAALVYLPSFSVGFLSDDYHWLSVTENHTSTVWHYFLTNIIDLREGSSYGPVANIFFTFMYAVFGLHAAWYHVVMLILHVATAFLLYQVVSKRTQSWQAGALAAVLFISFFHHTEAVVWVASFPHVLATLFFVWSLERYTHFLKQQKRSSYIVALGLATLALFTKEIAMTIFGVWLLLEWFEKKDSWAIFLKRLALRFMLPAGIFLTYCFLRKYATGFAAGFYANTGLFASARELWGAFVELSLNLFVPYPYRHTGTLFLLSHLWLGIAIGITLFIIAIIAVRKRAQWPVFFFGFLVVMIPYLYVILDPKNNAGERYAYLPSVFFAALVAIVVAPLADRSQRWRMGMVSLCGIAVITSSALLYQKNSVWQTAGAVANKIIESYETLSIAPNDYVFFLGIPDNLSGAEVMRNAIKEALVLERAATEVQGERVPMYVVLSQANAFTDIVTVEKEVDLQFTFTSVQKERLFTGFPDYTYPLATFTMQEPDKKLFSGSGLVAQFNQTALDDMKHEGREVWVVYYSEGTLHKIRVGR